jgi:hypothetical protein
VGAGNFLNTFCFQQILMVLTVLQRWMLLADELD